MAYVIRGRSDFHVTLRTDILESRFAQVLEIRQGGHPPVLIVNIYNSTARSASQEWVVDDIINAPWPTELPIMLTGDWNLHHEWWEPARSPAASERAQRTVDWLLNHDFLLLNEEDEPTFFGHNGSHATTIDLTFANEAAIQVGAAKEWTTDRAMSFSSDHTAIRWVIDMGELPIDTTPNRKFNYKRADPVLFQECLVEKLQAKAETFNRINNITAAQSEEDIETAAEALLEALVAAAEATIPERRFSPHSKSFWNEELDHFLEELKEAEAVVRTETRREGVASEQATGRYLKARARFRRGIKATRRRDAEGKLADAKPTNVFEFKRWTEGKREYPSPAMTPRTGGTAVVQHEEKCELLLKELLPPSNWDPNDMPDLTRPYPGEAEMPPATRGEVRRAIFKPDPNKAPGPSGISFLALRWAWNVAEREMFSVFGACITAGYHPRVWKHTIGVALRKPRKESYAKTKSWRLIMLEECLAKVLEGIEAARMSHMACTHHLVAQGQFGGVPGRSTTDAGMAFVHDIECAKNRKKVSSALTFDVAGAFDHVSHPHLLRTLIKKKLPIAMIRWVASFIEGREVSISLDGKVGPRRPVSTGIPQGSPISPILFVIFTSPIEEVVEKYQRDNPDLQDRGIEKPSLKSFMDDGNLLVSSYTLGDNVTVLLEIWREIVRWGGSVGVKFDRDKKELTHFNTPRAADAGGGLPNIEIPAHNGEAPQLLQGRPEVVWLGMTFDHKLSFKTHVARMTSKAENALSALKMLANTKRGLHQKLLRILYRTCILPIMTYGSPLWWKGAQVKGTKMLEAKLTRVQNRALRWICGAFRTTPIRALEIEAAIMPIDIYLDLMNEKYALRLNRLGFHHPAVQRLPSEWRNGHNPLFPPPIAIQRGRERRPKPTRLTNIASWSDPTWERVEPFLEPPWRRTKHDDDLRHRVKFNLQRPGETKGEAAARHDEETRAFRDDPDHILVYTDGSQTMVTGMGLRAGAAVVAYKERQILWEVKFGLGAQSEVWDAEMAALTTAGSRITQVARDRTSDLGTTAKHLHFYTDNSGAAQVIFEGQTKPCQVLSTMFRRAILAFLDASPENTVEIAWVPGHQDIAGNEAVDERAKEAAGLRERYSFTSLTHAHRIARSRARGKWTARWAATQPSGGFALADRLPPTLTPREHFETLSRANYARVTQVRTGHGSYGEYCNRFVPSEGPTCQCGESVETREHVLRECWMHEEHRPILEEASEQIKLADILGTAKGIKALAQFTARSGAFSRATMQRNA
ncbi:hypothetical protein FRB90_006606 [Tulasnella sp. 427]|nr:hypothetical protein FRB90_006606 [Tulasnella sp. 427]